MTRWGIIAPGRIAHKFAKDLATVEGNKLVAVASRSLERAQDFATQYNAQYAYGSYEELLACPELDVVYVASPHIGHHDHTLLCLNAGIAVLCEKPFGMSLQQTQAMVKTAHTKKVFLMEALWTRFMPTTLKMLELMPTIGKINLVKADFGFKAPFDPEKRLYNKDLGGGALLDIGIYPLFISYLTLGNPTQIEAVAQFSETGVDETVGMVLKYEDGALAALDCTLAASTPCEAQIFGELGTITIHGRWHESQSLTVNYYDGRVENHNFKRSTFGYDFEIEAVSESLAAGQLENNDWSLKDSINLMTLLDAVRAKTGIVYE